MLKPVFGNVQWNRGIRQLTREFGKDVAGRLIERLRNGGLLRRPNRKDIIRKRRRYRGLEDIG
jgi:hypothetical protein